MHSPSTLDMEEPPRPNKVKNILDYGEEEMGEVAEWVNHTSNKTGAKNKKNNIYSDSESDENNSDFDDVFQPQLKIENSIKQNDKIPTSTPTKHKNTRLSGKKEEEVKIKEHEGNKNENARKEKNGVGLEIENLEDWDEISKNNLANLVHPNILVQSESDFTPIYFPEAWQIIKNLDLSKERKSIVAYEYSGESILLRYFPCIVKRMSNALLSERDQVFSFAKVQFNDKNPLHFRMLYTFYINLTGKKNCVRYGDHWEKVGFQGRDPATDLRGVGMFGVLQMLAFVSFHLDLIVKIYEYSIDEKFGFPFAAALLNISEIVLDCLRKGKLTNLINNSKSVINAVNGLYFATMHKLFMVYKGNKMTESDFGELKKKIEADVERNIEKTIEKFKNEKEILIKMN